MRGQLTASLSIAAGVFAVLAGCHHDDVQAVTDDSVPVTAESVSPRDVVVSVVGAGTVQALSTVLVRPRVDGQVTSIDFSEGQEVVAGAPLAHLDARPYQAQLAQARAVCAKDEALLGQAAADLDRNKQLFDSGLITAQSYDAMRFQQMSATAAVAADQAAVDVAQLQLDFCIVTAPCAGRSGARLIDAGSLVHATDDRGFVVLTQVQPIDVAFTVPQDRLADVLAASRSDPPATVEVRTRDGGAALATGRLAFVDSQIDSTTGMARLKARFGNEDRSLWPGQLVTARLVVSTAHDALAVADRAIVRGPAGPCAWVVGTDDRVALRSLVLGPQADGSTVATGGLKSGDRVVIDGQYRLRGGTRVRPHPAAAASPAQAITVDAR